MIRTASKKRNNANMMFLLIILLTACLCSLSYGASDEFSSTVRLTTSSSDSLSIDLIDPDGDTYKSGDSIGFRYVVSYNKTDTLACDLMIDGNNVHQTVISDGNEKMTSTNINITEGIREWQVSCITSGNQSATSSTKEFIIDLTEPTITQINPDPDVSLTDSITLNYSVTDNLASSMDCELKVNNITKSTNIVAKDSTKAVTLTGLENGTYEWDVTCEDTGGNSHTTSKKIFYIDTKKNFSIRTNKDEYLMGEGGVIVVTAPYGATVKLMITTPENRTSFRQYTGPFPQIDEMNITDYPGLYELEGFMNYNGAIKTNKTTFNVKNTLTSSIWLNTSKTVKNSDVKFRANAGGGIGTLSYYWEFGDGATSSEKNVNHRYSNIGNYNVRLVITDSKSNVAESTLTVSVEDKFTTNIEVYDIMTNEAVKDASISVDDTDNEAYTKYTGDNGKATFELFKGDHKLQISHKDYKPYFNLSFDIEGTDTYKIYIEKKEYNITEQIDAITGNNEKTDEYIEVSDNKNDENKDSISSTYSEIQEIIEQMNTAMSSLDKKGNEEQTIIDLIDLKNAIQMAIKNLRRADRDLWSVDENRRGLTEKEQAEERKRIYEDIDNTKENTIKDIRVSDSKKYVTYPSSDEVKDFALDYINNENIKTDQEEFLKAIEELQQMISVTTEVIKTDTEYFSGKSGSLVLVTHSFGAEELPEETYFIIQIPKDMAQDKHMIKVLSQYEQSDDDSYLIFDTSKASTISYYINEDISISTIENKIKPILLSKNIKIKKSGFSAVGYAIFSKIEKIDDPVLVMEVIAIVLLVLIYLFYQFDLISIIREKMFLKNKDLFEIKGMIKDLKNCLKNNEISNAEVIYEDIMKMYEKLDSTTKPKIHRKTEDLHNRIVVSQIQQLVDLGFAMIKSKDIDHARKKYEEVQNLYTHLTENNKAAVAEKCTALYQKLAEA